MEGDNMASDTPLDYRNLVIYQVFVRNYRPNGKFSDVEGDLERIRSMGVDVVYFLPVHPIGTVQRKGSLGSPYSIVNYRAINEELGTKEDFKRLVDKIHESGMKVMMDIVFNHTAHDSVVVHEHPDWFHQDADGKPITTVPEWSDVIDFKFSKPQLSEYLIDVLKYWADFGADGFRCDVAPLVPLEFWEKARDAVAQVKQGVIWLAESVHTEFVISRRKNGLETASDSELYRAFDMTYDYEIWPTWQRAVMGMVPPADYIDLVRLQDGIYPSNYVKMRCVENHDQPRIMRLAPSGAQAQAWTALSAFTRGPFLIYAGQEAASNHRSSLFDPDPVEWGSYSLQDFITRLAKMKKELPQKKGELIFTMVEPVIQAVWYTQNECLYGIFNIREAAGSTKLPLADGSYTNLLTDELVTFADGKATIPESALILRCTLDEKPQPVPSNLLDGVYIG
jgi:hypothetical protein